MDNILLNEKSHVSGSYRVPFTRCCGFAENVFLNFRHERERFPPRLLSCENLTLLKKIFVVFYGSQVTTLSVFAGNYATTIFTQMKNHHCWRFLYSRAFPLRGLPKDTLRTHLLDFGRTLDLSTFLCVLVFYLVIVFSASPNVWKNQP